MSKLESGFSEVSKNWIETPKEKNWLIPSSEGFASIISKIKTKKINSIEETLKKNRTRILDNWDNSVCKEFNEGTWKQTTNLIETVLKNLWYNDINIHIPIILPYYDSSFDIHWENEVFHLTVNIPSVLNQSVDLYGQKIGSPEYELEVLTHYDLVETVINSWLKKIL